MKNVQIIKDEIDVWNYSMIVSAGYNLMAKMVQ